MGGSGETGAQRGQRLEAERIARETKAAADKEQADKEAFDRKQTKKAAEFTARGKGMQGGGRGGLMYQGSNAGVK